MRGNGELDERFLRMVDVMQYPQKLHRAIHVHFQKNSVALRPKTLFKFKLVQSISIEEKKLFPSLIAREIDWSSLN